VNYLRYNDDDPRYFPPRSSDEGESFLKVIGDGHRFFSMLSSDEFVISFVLIELMSY